MEKNVYPFFFFYFAYQIILLICLLSTKDFFVEIQATFNFPEAHQLFCFL